MIVPVAVRIGYESRTDEYSLDGMTTIAGLVDRTYSLQTTMLDLETGEFRTYAFRSVRSSEPDDAELIMDRGRVDEHLRALRAGLDRWLGGELARQLALDRVKDFVREASPRDVGAVMGACLSVLDERGDADIVRLLRELTEQTREMVEALRREER